MRVAFFGLFFFLNQKEKKTYLPFAVTKGNLFSLKIMFYW